MAGGNDTSEHGLIEAAIGGSQHAWDAIVDRFAPHVWGVVLKHGLDRDRAASVHQATWEDLADRLPTIDPYRLRHWLTETASEKAARAKETIMHCVRAERRSHARVAAALPLTIAPPYDDRIFSGETVNVSLGGLYGHVAMELPRTRVGVLIGITTDDSVIVTKASLISATASRPGAIAVRVAFDDLHGARREALRRRLRACA
jgi:hypothetical protein